MRIAHISATFPPYRGGTGTVCYHNALEVARLGHAVEVFTAAYGAVHGHIPDASDDPPDVRVHRLRPLIHVGNAPLTPALLQLGQFDLIHLHYPYIFGAELTTIRALIGRTPTVITYHQDVILGGAMGAAIRAHEQLFGKAMLARADRLLFTSLDYGRSSRVAGLVDRMGARVGDLPNGVDPAAFHPQIDASAIRARYGLADSDRVALFVGGLDSAHYFKGVPVLLDALAQIDDARVKVMIVGDGDLRAQFEAQAGQSGIADRVIFAGRVPQAELAAHYALCDVFVLPSVTMGEAFGIVLLEAMACGKPVIATDLPGVRTVARHDDNGLIVPPHDARALAAAIRALMDDPGRRARMGARGRARVESTYDWARIGAALTAIYDEVIAGRGGARLSARGTQRTEDA